MKSLLDLLHNTKIQAILAYIILIGGSAIIVFGKVSETVDNRIFDLMFLVGTFFYGSSKSSASKDETISSLSANQAPATNIDTVNVKA